MHDAGAVRGLQPAGDLQRQAQGFGQRQRPAAQALAQGDPLDQLADQQLAALHLRDLMDGEDVRMVERRDGERLAAETADALGIVRQVRRQELDGDPSLEVRIDRQVHRSHAARADLLQQLEAAQPPAAEVLGLARFGLHRLAVTPDQKTDRLLADRILEKAVVAVMGEQRLDLAAQLEVTAAPAIEQGAALGGRTLERRGEELVDPLPTLGVHRPQAHSSSRRRKALARCQSRVTVSGWTASRAAVSSTLRPPK